MMLNVYISKTFRQINGQHSLPLKIIKDTTLAGKSPGVFLGDVLSLCIYCTCICSWQFWVLGIKRDGTCDSLSYLLVKVQCNLISKMLTYSNYFNDYYRIELKKHLFTLVDFRENTSSVKLVHYTVPGYSDSNAKSLAFLGFPAFLCIFIQIRANS